MKKLVATFLIICLYTTGYSKHISGGELYYKAIETLPNGMIRYEITLRLFRDCYVTEENAAAMPSSVIIGIFHNNSQKTIFNDNIVVERSNSTFDRIQLQHPNICIQSPPAVCYEVGYFSKIVDLPANDEGYILAYQTCCRISNLVNVINTRTGNNGEPGATYSATIPGKNILGQRLNSSPVFNVKDTVLVCAGRNLALDFGAVDPDGDKLTYSFCEAYDGGSARNAQNTPPANPNNYVPLTYTTGFSGNSPLGPGVTINPETGIIEGRTPPSNTSQMNVATYYVVNVCATEWRDGVAISVHKKDFILKVSSCNIAAASLPANDMNCKAFETTFVNGSNSPLIKTYYWDFDFKEGVPGTATSTDARPQFTYTTAGNYKVMLIINREDQCSDTAYMNLGVFPGFKTDFVIDEACVTIPVDFYDQTTYSYGTLTSWKWHFGDPNNNNSTSNDQNPQWQYSSEHHNVQVRLISESSVGCIDTAIRTFNILDKPEVKLAFKDTLMCNLDDLQLISTSRGDHTWSPDVRISDLHSPTPIVNPQTTTTYRIDVSYKGCFSTDYVKVNVVHVVSLDIGSYPVICLTDTFHLKPVTDALKFTWSSSAQNTLDQTTIKNPVALPLDPVTTYTLFAEIGSCNTTEDVTIITDPYPIVNAGDDHLICSDSAASLIGTHDADVFRWGPVNTLTDPQTLTPKAHPKITTEYFLAAKKLDGCLKEVQDIVRVQVIPPVRAFAGNDTAIVVGQPLALQASGGVVYEWWPSIGMNDNIRSNPVTLLNESQTFFLKVIDQYGCYNFDTLQVTVFKTAPDIFVPNAFTPNNDGKNDLFTPVPVGIATFKYFRVYSRWGQLVFSTNVPGKGWDGRMNGALQKADNYVWVAEGIDYLGNTVFRKGNVVLVK